MDSLQPLLASAFTAWGAPVTWLEIAACVASVAMVLCNFRVHPAAWPLAIASSAAYALLFAHHRLYGEAALQGVFIGVALWGWWLWMRKPESGRSSLRVGSMTRRARLQAALLTLAAWPLLGLLLSLATDSDVPYLDAAPTVGSVLGQVLLARKRVENWPVWLGVNVFSVALFAYKGLWLTVWLYAAFAWMSVLGWRAWIALEAASDARERQAAPGHG